MKHHYEVNFFLIKKSENVSKIKLCWKEDDLVISHNYTPSKETLIKHG